MTSDAQHFVESFIYDRGSVELIVVSGPDSPDFLNRLSTQNFKANFTGSLHGAFLNGQAKLISLFTAWKKDDKNYFFVEKEMLQETKDYLEKMHFTENLKIENEKYYCIEVRGKNQNFPSEMSAEAFDWGIPGKYFFDLGQFEVKSILEKNYDAIRASFGFPKPLTDITNEHILIEGPFDSFIDRNKGCYPGQEVVEKIYTYGRVARKIKKIIFSDFNHEDFLRFKSLIPYEVEFEGNKVGTLTSIYQLSGETYGLATFKRLFYEKNESLEIKLDDKSIKGTIKN